MIDEQHVSKYHFCYSNLVGVPIESEPKDEIHDRIMISRASLFTSVFSHAWISTTRSAFAIASLASNNANRIPIQLLYIPFNQHLDFIYQNTLFLLTVVHHQMEEKSLDAAWLSQLAKIYTTVQLHAKNIG